MRNLYALGANSLKIFARISDIVEHTWTLEVALIGSAQLRSLKMF